jgi:hypothetical protein
MEYHKSKMLFISPFNYLFTRILSLLLQKCKYLGTIATISLLILNHNNCLEKHLYKLKPEVPGQLRKAIQLKSYSLKTDKTYVH